MKKVVMVFLSFFLFMTVSNAAAYYYQTDDGNYMLCGGREPGCFAISQNQEGATFHLGSEQIIYEGHTYYYDDYEQQEYYSTLYGNTRMFYYIDERGRYVLCDTEDSCSRYTFEQLTNRGASITTNSKIEMYNGDGPGDPGDVYYFNASKQDEVNNSQTGDNGNTTTPDRPDTGNDSNETISLDDTEYCGKLKEPLKFIGRILQIIKIVIPLLIIAFGVIDLFRAIIGSKDDELKKSIRSLVMRCIAGVVIFFLPTLVSIVFSLIDSWANIEGEFNACQKCVLNVRECE